MIKKTLYLSEEAAEMFLKLATGNGNNQSQFFESLVRETYQRKMQDNISTDVKNKMVFEQLDKIRRTANSSNKMIFVLLEILNSFISTGINKTDGDDYTSAEVDPHPWIDQAYHTLDQKIISMKHSAAARGDK